MITIKAARVCENYVSGDCLTIGKAYRLADSETSRGFIGSIYLKGLRDIMSLNNPGSIRSPLSSDKYIEVDLEVTVKEKT
jgi:hypothetical protein